MLERIAEAERRASEAEQRAREAVDSVAAPIPEIDPAEIFSERAGEPEPPGEPEPADRSPMSRSRRPSLLPGRSSSRSPCGAGAEHRARGAAEPELDTASGAPVDGEGPGALVPARTRSRSTRPSYEQLRALGLSVTQTGRVLAHREKVGGFTASTTSTTSRGSRAPSSTS